MIIRFLIISLLSLSVAACNQNKQESDKHDEHGETKFQYTSYSKDFELFAEADAFVVGEKANVLSHFSSLPGFMAVEEGQITLVLNINGKEVRQTLDKPTRKGIYSFDIQPEAAGKGTLRYEISTSKGNYEVLIPEITVFANDQEAHEAAEKVVVPKTNTTVFTKEQAWKINFTTGYPVTKPFGQVIKTTALVQAAQGNEMVITAKSGGVVLFTSDNLLEGKEVKAGQSLFTISGNGLADNNITVKYAEAKSNFEKAKADYERAKELATDKIVSEKDLLAARNQYETAKAVYDNLSKNTGESGQTISSPLSGFVKQLFVKNGSYVEAGQAVLVVSQNKTLVLTAEVPQRYASVLGTVQSANIQSINDKVIYSFEQLNGKVLSYGKAANTDNYLLPVNLQIDNKGNFVPGSFVDVYLKSIISTQALTVPATALLEEQGNYFVWVQVTPELFEKREVRIGATDGLEFEIKEGVSVQERIVTRGAMIIKLAQATGSLDAHSGHVH